MTSFAGPLPWDAEKPLRVSAEFGPEEVIVGGVSSIEHRSIATLPFMAIFLDEGHGVRNKGHIYDAAHRLASNSLMTFVLTATPVWNAPTVSSESRCTIFC